MTPLISSSRRRLLCQIGMIMMNQTTMRRMTVVWSLAICQAPSPQPYLKRKAILDHNQLQEMGRVTCQGNKLHRMRTLTRVTAGRQQATTKMMVTPMLIALTVGSSCVESLEGSRAMDAVSAFITKVTIVIDAKVAEIAATTMTVGAITIIITIITAKIVATVAATAISLSIKISEALVEMAKQAKVATITEVITEVVEIISASKAVNMTSLTKTK